MIDREMLRNMVDGIAKQGQWDMSKPMLWGYFFTHGEPKQLQAIVPALQALDYEFVDIFQSKKDDPAQPDLEIHSVESPFVRNEQLSEFAEEHQVDSYDGMDVGPPHSPERLS